MQSIRSRRCALLLAPALLFAAGTLAAHGEHDHDVAAKSDPAAASTSTARAFGAPLPVSTGIPLAQALGQPDDGMRTVSGRIGRVCQNKGCWMTLHDGEAMVRVETAHRFAIPADSVGNALVHGTLKRKKLSEDRAAHLRSESLPVEAGDAWVIDAVGVQLVE